MAFSETTKLEAKRRSAFQCCVCKEPFVEVHHIIPQSFGGSDQLENAAPLCGSCHDRYGANPEKRKQIREMRDLWWEICDERKKAPEFIAFNERLDAIHSGLMVSQLRQLDSETALRELKEAFFSYTKHSLASVQEAFSLHEFQVASGIALPTAMTALSYSVRCPRCQSGNTEQMSWTDGYLGEVRECRCWHQQFHVTQTY